MQEVREVLKNAGGLLSKSWRLVLLFQIVFQAFTSLAVFPLCRVLYNACLKWSGVNCFTADTAVDFFKSSIMLGCALLLFVVFTLNLMLEISCLISILHHDHERQPLSIGQVLRLGLFDMYRLLRLRNRPMLLLLAFLMPLLQLSLSTSLLGVTHLSGTTLRGYLTTMPYSLVLAVYALILILLMLWAQCALQVYILEDVPMRRAFRTGSGVLRGRRIRMLLTVVLPVGALITVCVLLTTPLKQLFAGLLTALNVTEGARYSLTRAFSTILAFLTSSIPSIVGYAIQTAIYDMGKLRCGEALPKRELPVRPNAAKQNRIAFYVTVIGCLVLLVAYDTALRPILVRLDVVELMPDATLAIAHRGDNKNYDENSVAAIRAAWEQGADYVEIDVQLTSDGVCIVQHDKNFRRVYGVNRTVWTTPYSVAAEFRGLKSREPLCTLEQLLEQLDPQTNLLIELKDTGHNEGLARTTFEVLSEAGWLDRVVIQSASYTMLRQFKLLSPTTTCGYIVALSVGSYVGLSAADFFSLDMSFINQEVVNAVHRAGKRVYCWTVDTQANARTMLALGVDGIITNDIPMLRELLIVNTETALDGIIQEPLEAILSEEDVPTAEETIEPEATAAPGEGSLA